MDRVGIEWRGEERGMKEIRNATESEIPSSLRLHSFQMLNEQQYFCYLYLLHDFKWNTLSRLSRHTAKGGANGSIAKRKTSVP